MGMFDYIYFLCDLPEQIEKYRMGHWQTKGFSNHMEEYIIDQHKTLFKEVSHLENVPENQRFYYGTEQWDMGELFKLCGSQKKVIDSYSRFTYNGVIECHCWHKENKTMSRIEINFVNGVVDYMEILTS